ncbi:VOC family protein [Actinomadura sp. NTSP31]|uniref:VOC family protein n=1 Tax=Actinomadura sp. NTSP31 TaxID=1735447 RepID=UPI0035C21AE0
MRADPSATGAGGRQEAQQGREHAVVGAVGHIAMDVETLEEVVALRDRIRSRGIQVIGPIDHGWWKSIYFAGPDDINLEITTGGDIKPENWVLPEVVELCGISPEELERLQNPVPFDASQGPVAQPPYDPSKPHMEPLDVELYAKGLEMTDEEVWETFSYTKPPVPDEQ